MNPFEFEGNWHSPSSDQRVSGILRSTADGTLTLSLFGCFGSPKHPADAEEYPIILGDLFGHHSECVSLVGCYITKTEYRSSGMFREEYHVQSAFFGIKVTEPTQLVFRHVQVVIGGLRQWSRSYSGFRLEPFGPKKSNDG